MRNKRFERDNRTIELIFLNRRFSDRQLDSLNMLSPAYGPQGTRLKILQRADQLTAADCKRVLEQLNMEEIRIRALENRLENLRMMSPNDASQLIQEIRLLDSSVTGLTAGFQRRVDQFSGTDLVLAVGITRKSSRPLTAAGGNLLIRYLRTRLPGDTLIVYFNEIKQ